MTHPQLILASASPRRQELLTKLGFTFTSQPADIDETEYKGEKPFDYCKRIARQKAQKVHAEHPNTYVLSADTPVIVGRKILQTPQTEDEAKAMLRQQSGRRIYVATALCLITPEEKYLETLSKTWLKFKPLTEAEITAHVANKANWEGASGAFKIQSSAIEALIKQTCGSFSGVMGLPLYETSKLLQRAGLNPHVS